MTNDKRVRTDKDALFNSLVEASGVEISENEKKDLRKAYSALMSLAERARPKTKERPWEIRMAPYYTPKFLNQNTKK